MRNILIIFISSLTLLACSKGGDDRLAEKENIKARQQLDAANENRRVLNEGAERELNELKFIMKTIEGKYKGSLTISNTFCLYHLL
jgi:hypothetical protein